MSTRDSRHAAIRERAVKFAYELLEREGEDAVQARRISDAASCSVGTLYNVFGSLDRLWADLNALTLAGLDQTLDEALDLAETKDAGDRGIVACRTLLQFADQNKAQWRALAQGPVALGAVPESCLEHHAVSIRIRELIQDAISETHDDVEVRSRYADALLVLVEGFANRIAARRYGISETGDASVVMIVALRKMLASSVSK